MRPSNASPFRAPDNGLLGLTRGKFLSAVATLPLQFQIVSLDLNAPSCGGGLALPQVVLKDREEGLHSIPQP